MCCGELWVPSKPLAFFGVVPTWLPAELVPWNRAMTQTELAAAIVVYLDALYNLAAWLARDSAAASALVQATCRQALRAIPQDLSGAHPRVGLVTILWRLYREDHRLSGDGLSDRALEQIASDKRVLYHTLSRADLDAGLRQLPEALRAALILTTMEGYSLEDLTTIFGWSKPRAQLVLAAARQLLDRSLQANLTSVRVPPAPEVKDVP
jgi:DNA-directed RNA polymerase specialized sigma24 family protein